MIYLDHASTAPICDAAKKAIIDHLDTYGNPSSSYEFARQSRLLIEDARARIAKCINAEPDEIYFTSGGSEANTMALNKRRSSLSSKFEHHSINPYYNGIGVNVDGFIEPQSLKSFVLSLWGVLSDTVSCMYVNNELGTVQPIKELAKISHKSNLLFHSDGVQAVGQIPVDVKDLDCDMLSASGHKFGAPKGVGFLCVKNGIPVNPIIYGGKQEQGLRGGTENVLGIVAMAAALEDAIEHMEERNKYIKSLRDKLLDKLLQIDGAHLNGSVENRVASNINIRFDGVSGARLVTLCDLYGICISAGSACNEGEATPSHVLKAIGLSDEEALSSIRITLGHENTEDEIDYVADIIIKLVERIRHEED